MDFRKTENVVWLFNGDVQANVNYRRIMRKRRGGDQIIRKQHLYIASTAIGF